MIIYLVIIGVEFLIILCLIQHIIRFKKVDFDSINEYEFMPDDNFGDMMDCVDRYESNDFFESEIDDDMEEFSANW